MPLIIIIVIIIITVVGIVRGDDYTCVCRVATLLGILYRVHSNTYLRARRGCRLLRSRAKRHRNVCERIGGGLYLLLHVNYTAIDIIRVPSA